MIRILYWEFGASLDYYFYVYYHVQRARYICYFGVSAKFDSPCYPAPAESLMETCKVMSFAPIKCFWLEISCS
jgi:hypothetical protein